MTITLTCRCGKRLQVADKLAGKTVTCPACAQVIPVSQEASAVSVKPLPPAPRSTPGASGRGGKKPVPVGRSGLQVIILLLLLAFLVIGALGAVAVAGIFFLDLHTKVLQAFQQQAEPDPLAKIQDENKPPVEDGPVVKKIDDTDPPFKDHVVRARGFKLLVPGSLVDDEISIKKYAYAVLSYTRKDGVFLFTDGHSDFVNPFDKELEGELERYRDLALLKTKCKLVKETRIKLNDEHPGLDIEGRSTELNDQVLRARVFFVEREDGGVSQMFLIAVFGNKEFIQSPDASRFLDSLTLIRKSDREVPPVVAGGYRLSVSPDGPLRVGAVALSPDDRWLATGCEDTVKIWDLALGKQVRSLRGHKAAITSMVFSRDGKWLVTGADDNTVRVWEFATGEQVRSFDEHTGRVSSVALSSDDEWIVSSSWDGTAKVWERATGKLVLSTAKHPYLMHAVALSADKKWLISGAASTPQFHSEATVWEVATGNKIRALGLQDVNLKGISAMAMSKDGQHVVLAWENKLSWTELASGKLLRSLSLGSSYCVLSNEGNTLIVGAAHGGYLCDMTTGNKQRSFGYGRQTSGQLGFPSITCCALSSDGKRLVTGGGVQGGAQVLVWDTATGWPLCGLVSCSDGAWAVFDVDGRTDYDREPSALSWIRDNNAVGLSNFKDRFHDPGLLAKYMGFNQRPVRAVPLDPKQELPVAENVPLVDGRPVFKVYTTKDVLTLEEPFYMGTAMNVKSKRYHVTLAEGITYQFEFRPGRINYLRLYDLEGKRLSGDEDLNGLRGTRIVHTPQKTATFLLEASCEMREARRYTLTIRSHETKLPVPLNVKLLTKSP